MYCIFYWVKFAYFTELNLQICNYAQKRRTCREKSKYALDERFYGHFCPRWKAANFCHPGLTYKHREKQHWKQMYDYCIMIVCNIGPAWRHDCTHEAKPMTTYCTQHFDPYKKTTTGKPTSKMTPPKKQPPKARHGSKFSCQFQSCTKGDSPSFLSRSWWTGRVVGLACAYLIMFRSPMSVRWHQHQWVESQPHHCHTIPPVIHTHTLCKDSGESSDLPVSFVTITLSGRAGVNGWKFSDLWTCMWHIWRLWQLSFRWGGLGFPDRPLIRCHSSHSACHLARIRCNWWQYSDAGYNWCQ